MPGTFDDAALALLRDAKEVRIRTSRSKRAGVIIWVVVADDGVFVRSVQGPAGKWYTTVAADGRATLVLDAYELPVRAVAVADQATIDAVSQAFLSKYGTSPYAQAMVRAEVLPTTLRLEVE
ncbi:MAG TPA: DUF2255 family protein [Acetobacteraceae bacterium]|nr:DUF2255 family protein [Acetobacteraceae bacterium]